MSLLIFIRYDSLHQYHLIEILTTVMVTHLRHTEKYRRNVTIGDDLHLFIYFVMVLEECVMNDVALLKWLRGSRPNRPNSNNIPYYSKFKLRYI